MAEDSCATVDALGKRVAARLTVTLGLPEWFWTKDVSYPSAKVITL
jgi:hypothetical protein